MRGGMGGMSGEAEGVLRAPWGALGAAQGRLEFFNFLFFLFCWESCSCLRGCHNYVKT